MDLASISDVEVMTANRGCLDPRAEVGRLEVHGETGNDEYENCFTLLVNPKDAERISGNHRQPLPSCDPSASLGARATNTPDYLTI